MELVTVLGWKALYSPFRKMSITSRVKLIKTIIYLRVFRSLGLHSTSSAFKFS